MTATTRAGHPVWMDLMTDDVEGAKTFYGELFGWEFADQGEDFGHYHLIIKDGSPVGGLMTTMMDMNGPTTEPTGPTRWSVYLHSDDVAGVIERLDGTGATLVFGPMDVADQGRQAFLVDPAGAAFGLWQPDQMAGFDLTLTPGTPVWFECLSTDFDAALPFYRDVLGWDIAWMPGSAQEKPGSSQEKGEGFRYATNGAGDAAVCGLCDASEWLPEGVPSFWRAYLAVEDADASAARAAELGGTVQAAPEDSPFGRFAQLADPQGGVFMINQAANVGGDLPS